MNASDYQKVIQSLTEVYRMVSGNAPRARTLNRIDRITLTIKKAYRKQLRTQES